MNKFTLKHTSGRFYKVITATYAGERSVFVKLGDRPIGMVNIYNQELYASVRMGEGDVEPIQFDEFQKMEDIDIAKHILFVADNSKRNV